MIDIHAFRILAMLPFVAGGLASADSRPHVSIMVNLDGRTCVVQQRTTSCMTLPDVLERELGVKHNASLSVGSEGCGREAMDRARTVAGNLKAAGFSRVAVVGFVTGPDANCAR